MKILKNCSFRQLKNNCQKRTNLVRISERVHENIISDWSDIFFLRGQGGINHSEPNYFVFLVWFRALYSDSNDLSYFPLTLNVHSFEEGQNLLSRSTPPLTGYPPFLGCRKKSTPPPFLKKNFPHIIYHLKHFEFTKL